AWHFFAAAWPFSTEAVCSSFSIGSEGAAAAAASLPWPSSLAAMAKPGFSGSLGANIALAVKFITRRTMQVASTAPRILLISKESILDQAPGRKGCRRTRPCRPPEQPGNRTFAAHPKQGGDIGLPRLWQPV